MPSINFQMISFGSKWNLVAHQGPEEGTTVLGLWQHYDPINGMMHVSAHLCEWWGFDCESEDDEEDDYGWFITDSYHASKGEMRKNARKANPPTFWCDVFYEDGDTLLTHTFRAHAPSMN